MIRTDPPGATVYVNDQLKGTTPLTYDFLWFGWHRLTLRKEGFERLDDRKELRSPVYLWIPFDLAMELMPFSVHDARTWSYTLTPTVMPTSPAPPVLLEPPAPSAASDNALEPAASPTPEPSHDPTR